MDKMVVLAVGKVSDAHLDRSTLWRVSIQAGADIA
jgi:hypothetical protein